MEKRTDLDKLLEDSETFGLKSIVRSKTERDWLISHMSFPSKPFIERLYELKIGLEYQIKDIFKDLKPNQELVEIIKKDFKNYIYTKKYGRFPDRCYLGDRCKNIDYVRHFHQILPEIQIVDPDKIKILSYPINRVLNDGQRALLYLKRFGKGPCLIDWLPNIITKSNEFDNYFNIWYTQFVDLSYAISNEGQAALIDLTNALENFTDYIKSLRETIDVISLIANRNTPEIRKAREAHERGQLLERQFKMRLPAKALFSKKEKNE